MAVFGCGTIGLFVIMVARALGATRVIGVEPEPQEHRHGPAAGRRRRDPRGPGQGGAQHGWSADKELVHQVREAFGGIGADVAMEMAGFNTSVNNAIQSTRRGGDVILFGLKQGNFHIQAFDRMIVNGLTLHSVIGRRIFEDWYITRNLLEDRTNGIQDRIRDVILGGGDGGGGPHPRLHAATLRADPGRLAQAADPVLIARSVTARGRIDMKITIEYCRV